jgi:hypothetical protein
MATTILYVATSAMMRVHHRKGPGGKDKLEKNFPSG